MLDIKLIKENPEAFKARLATRGKDFSEEIDKLLDIAINNHPVRYLLNDKDVNRFYKKIIKKMTKPNEKSQKVESYFKKKGKK